MQGSLWFVQLWVCLRGICPQPKVVAAERWPESSFKSGLCFVVSLFLSSLDFTYTVCVCLCVCLCKNCWTHLYLQRAAWGLHGKMNGTYMTKHDEAIFSFQMQKPLLKDQGKPPQVRSSRRNSWRESSARASLFLWCLNSQKPKTAQIYEPYTLKTYEPCPSEVSHCSLVANPASPRKIDSKFSKPRAKLQAKRSKM